jgi:CubicO group peptidase (beta-lactamase class C family)
VFGPDGVLERHGDIARSFPLASVSKPLAAIAVHVAAEEGTVGLDDPAGPPGSTVRHLLAHASGLPPDGDRQPLGPPEGKRVYSNVGFEVLAEHVGSLAGMPFDEYARLALVESLALHDTDVSGSPAHGYRSSVRDLCAVIGAALSGQLLARSSVQAMTSPAFPELAGVLPGYGAQDPNPWGLGVEVRGDKSPHWTSPDNSPATWGHFGRSGTFVWYDPDAGIGLVVLTDRDFGPWAVEAWPALSTTVLAAHH